MEVTPSILTADYTRLGETLDEAIDAGIEWIHLDVMDGNWVVNRTITFGPALIRSVRDRLGPEIFIDCHLMVTNAEETWSQYVDAGVRSEEHTSELQSRTNLVCRLLLEKKKKKNQ